MAAVDPLGGRSVADLRDIVQLVEEDLARVEELFEAQFRSDVGLVGEIGRYIRAGGGKRIRPALLLLACRLCGYRGDRAITLASVVEPPAPIRAKGAPFSMYSKRFASSPAARISRRERALNPRKRTPRTSSSCPSSNTL